MYFYNIRVKAKKNQWFNNSMSRDDRYNTAMEICSRCDEFAELHEGTYFWVNKINASLVNLGAIVNYQVDINEYVELFLKEVNIEHEDNIDIKEIGFIKARDNLNEASRRDFVLDEDEVLSKFGIEVLNRRYSRELDFKEYLANSDSKEKLYKFSQKIFVDHSMNPEIDRIFQGSVVEIQNGHPVHYMVMADEIETQYRMCKILINALYTNKRVINKRYSTIDFSSNTRFSPKEYKELYQINSGGTVVVNFHISDDEEDDQASASREVIETLCRTAKKYRKEVLTIFVLPRECTCIKKIYFEYLSNMSIVELSENSVSGSEARKCLEKMALENGVKCNDSLFEKIEEEKTYYGVELKNIFDIWYDIKLKTQIYPQYNYISTINREHLKDKPKGNAYDKLMKMIGLDEAKKVINQAVKYHKAQRVFVEKGMKAEKPSMHMVFTGNPGTAKTTVARLFAQIMRENELLSRGHIVEVGRSDLVGKYVGWTAPTIKRKFVEAKGGVLFIDEAYSLVDDRSGSYGDEAINMIVQEMENHREDVVVIFAGYPEEMEQFLQKNPGLKSRIAFHVPFADYDTDDLCGIAQLIAKDKGIVLSEGATKRLREDFERARGSEDFGNGRYVRNVLEKAKMAQAARLLEADYEQLSSDDVVTICEEDIESNVDVGNKRTGQIGFVFQLKNS